MVFSLCGVVLVSFSSLSCASSCEKSEVTSTKQRTGAHQNGSGQNCTKKVTVSVDQPLHDFDNCSGCHSPNKSVCLGWTQKHKKETEICCTCKAVAPVTKSDCHFPNCMSLLVQKVASQKSRAVRLFEWQNWPLEALLVWSRQACKGCKFCKSCPCTKSFHSCNIKVSFWICQNACLQEHKGHMLGLHVAQTSHMNGC